MSVFHTEIAHLPPNTPDVFRRMMERLGDMDDKLGQLLPAYNNGFVDMPLTAVPLNPVLAPQCDFTVTGLDGKYEIVLTLPQNRLSGTSWLMRQMIANNQNSLFSPMVHQVQSSTTLLFDAAGKVTTYDMGGNLTLEIQDPNQTKFWRVRSSFDGQQWNDWKIYTSATVCGPVAVQSGFMRSTSLAPRSPLNKTNTAIADSVLDAGAADIRVYGPGGVGSSYVIYDGQSGQISVPGATILGAAFSTDYAVVWSPATGHEAFPTVTQYLKTIDDSLYYVATPHTINNAGAGGTLGGGGSGQGGHQIAIL